MSVLALRFFDAQYFTATIEILRTLKEKDADGDTRTLKDSVIATLPGRIVRGSNPIEIVQAERVVGVKNWEVRLSLVAIEKLEREKDCFEIKGSDRLRDKASGQTYQINGDDTGRTEANYLSVFCVQVG